MTTPVRRSASLLEPHENIGVADELPNERGPRLRSAHRDDLQLTLIQPHGYGPASEALPQRGRRGRVVKLDRVAAQLQPTRADIGAVAVLLEDREGDRLPSREPGASVLGPAVGREPGRLASGGRRRPQQSPCGTW